MRYMGTPLCIDLDGTLVRTDTLVESFFLLVKKNPFYAFMCVLWLLRGKAVLKSEVAKRVKINASSLPYNETLLAMLYEEHRNGRDIWLCTAANEKIAQSVSDYVGIFSKVIASNDTKNVSSSVKADEILSHTDSFDYAGNSSDDIKVWDKSTGAIVVDLPKKLINKVSVPILYKFDSDQKTIKSWLKEIRIHQWAKNLLIFIPILAAHEISKSSLLLDATLAFIAFGFCASSVYLPT